MRNIINIYSSFLILLLSAIISTPLLGQELNVEVDINRRRIEGTSLHYLDNLDEKIKRYFNGYDWTISSQAAPSDVNANIQIILTNISPNYTFTANIIIRSVRAIKHSTRRTTLFLYHDDQWSFQYLPNQSLMHNELQFNTVTTLLNFYANIILGYYYDSFTPLGGTPYFVEAQEQISIAQSSATAGWRQSNIRANSRVQLVTDLLDPNYELLRKAFYHYHQALDLRIKNLSKARRNIFKSLRMMHQAKQQTVNNLLFKIFFNAKYLEIVSIFKEASPKLQSKVYRVLAQTDVNHLNAYRQLQ